MPDKNTQPNDSQAASQTPVGESVFVMPNKYVVQPPKKSGMGTTLIIIIMVMVIFVTGGYLIYDMLAKPAAKTPVAQVIPPTIIIDNQASSTEVLATTTEVTASTTQATTTDSMATTTVAVTLPASMDSDKDGLTDIEETVLGTLPTNPDTDGDGYKDGAEVASNYSPTKAGSAKLSESPFVVTMDATFTTDVLSYLMPKDWQSSTITTNRQILISASTGEIIKLTASDNRDNMTPLGWYLRDHPEVSVSQLKIITSFDGALTGIYSPDGLNAWITDSARSKFYAFEYLTGRQTEIRFPAIFDMIIKSLTATTPFVEEQPVSVPITEGTSTI